MRRRNRINRIEDKILLEALNGPVWFYDLYAKKRIASNKKVLEALERLRDEGLLEQHRESKEHGKRRRIYYTLTLNGLAWILNRKPISMRIFNHKRISMIRESLKKFLEENKDKHWMLTELYHMIEEGYEGYVNFIFGFTPFDPKRDDAGEVFLQGLANLCTEVPMYVCIGGGGGYVALLPPASEYDEYKGEVVSETGLPLDEYLKKRPELRKRLKEAILKRIEILQRYIEDMRKALSKFEDE